ncbi:MAG: carbohydrate kinase family protein [Candidatus Bathyarchaeota archaeon]|nr:MAG: carbohydrate kinase family protein [Candidatus Bathyarchaeota archaeon]
MKFDAVGFGALNVDRLFQVNEIATGDEESFITGSKESCGGSAANTIIGLTRLGVNTGYIGKVADDREGQLLVNNLQGEAVDTAGIIVEKDGRTGTTMDFVGEEGDRALYVDPGVNDDIRLSEIDVDYVHETRFLHLTSFVGETSFQSQLALIQQLPDHVLVSLDPGMFYAKRGLASLAPIMRHAFAVLPNATELRLLAGEEYRDGAQKLIEVGVKVVGVKLGKQGCYVTDGHEDVELGAPRMPVVDTTGAGDAWNAGFLYGLVKKKSLTDCARLGNWVASKCITELGATTGLPTSDQLNEVLQ